jgi:Ni,Fe-hydrogenase I small subunit
MNVKSIKIQPTQSKTFHTPKTRIFISNECESILQMIQLNNVRPYTAYKKEIIPSVLKTLELPEDTKVRWSQNAGCACGCSPGFIVDGHYSKNIFVNVNDQPVAVV